MSRSSNLLASIERGSFGDVALGQLRSEVQCTRGLPTHISNAKIDGRRIEAIWKFGELEVFFDAADTVVGLQKSYVSDAATLAEFLDCLALRASYRIKDDGDTISVRFELGRSKRAQCAFRRETLGEPVLESISAFA